MKLTQPYLNYFLIQELAYQWLLQSYSLPFCIKELQKTFLKSVKKGITCQYLLVRAVSNIRCSAQKVYVMGDGVSFGSAFLRFFKLQVESFVLSDCWHEEDTYIELPGFFS